MFGPNLPRQKKGALIRAKTLNAPALSNERQGRFRVNTPLNQQYVGGVPLVRLADRDRMVMRLVAHLGSGKYTWTEQVATTGGGYATGASTDGGNDYFYEFNGTTTLTGLIVEAERDQYTGEWRGQMDQCATNNLRLNVLPG